MTTRPRITQVLEVDEKYLGKLQKQEQELQRLHSEINAGRSLKDIEAELAKVKLRLSQAESLVHTNTQRASDILERAGVEAARQLKKVEVDRSLILAGAREERQKLLAQAEEIVASAKHMKELQARQDESLSKREAEIVQQRLIIKGREEELGHEKDRLSQLDERLKFSQSEIAREGAEQNTHWTKLRENERKVETLIESLHQRSLDLEAREESLKKREVQAKADMEVASAKMREGQDRMNQAISYEASLKTREIELKQAEESTRVGVEDLRKRTAQLLEREKNCQIREAQIRARV